MNIGRVLYERDIRIQQVPVPQRLGDVRREWHVEPLQSPVPIKPALPTPVEPDMVEEPVLA